MASLIPASPADRADAAAFAGRVARWDPAGPVLLIGSTDPTGRIALWGTTPFDTLVTRSVGGSLHPDEVTVRAADLLAALAVSTAEVVDPGRGADGAWRDRIPPEDGWITLDRIPAASIDDLVAAGTAQARDHADAAGGAPASLLDSTVLTVSGAGQSVMVPMRMLFALSGMGFGGPADDMIKVRATAAWLRLDGRYGAVVRRRHAPLPLFV
ncbi:MAG TPA: hypothetical protein VIC62_24510 [Nakamurella sp.]|jgi:hypothetical protein